MRYGALATGFLALAVAGPILKATGTSGTGASQLASAANLPARFVTKFLDPTVPAFATPVTSAASSARAQGQGPKPGKYQADADASSGTPVAPRTTTQAPPQQLTSPQELV